MPIPLFVSASGILVVIALGFAFSLGRLSAAYHRRCVREWQYTWLALGVYAFLAGVALLAVNLPSLAPWRSVAALVSIAAAWWHLQSLDVGMRDRCAPNESVPVWRAWGIAALLAFARRQPIEPRILDVGARVADLERLLRRLLGDGVTWSAEMAPDRWAVRGDPSALGQIFVNLAVNARDAMPDGGALRVVGSNLAIAGSGHESLGIPRGEWVRLDLSDTGAGIEESLIGQIFEPYDARHHRHRDSAAARGASPWACRTLHLWIQRGCAPLARWHSHGRTPLGQALLGGRTCRRRRRGTRSLATAPRARCARRRVRSDRG